MGDDERRAKIDESSDAVRGDLHGTPGEWPERQPTDPDRGQLRDAATPASGRGRQSVRVRDARGDDEGHGVLQEDSDTGVLGEPEVCPHNDDDCAMGTCNFCGPDGVYGKRSRTRSPQDEDHEAGWREASARVIAAFTSGTLREDQRRALVALGDALRGPSPSRDGTVAVEDHQAVQREAHFAHVLSAIVGAYDHPADGTALSRLREAVDDARRLLHEPFPYFVSPASTGDREGPNPGTGHGQ